MNPEDAETKDAAPAPDIDAATELPRPWNDESTSIVVEGRSPEGPSRFEAARSELTAEQLQALDGLRRLPPPPGPPLTHFTIYRIRITDESGGVATYRAADGNFLNADEEDPTLPSLDADTLQPFLAAARCLQPEQTLDRLLDPASGSPDAGPSGEQAPSVSSSTPGCFHPVAMPVECRDVPLRLQVESAGTYQLSLASCGGVPMVLRVFSADGSGELGSAAGDRANCPVLVQSFPEPGSYPLTIRKGDEADCAGSGVWGSVFLRVRSAEGP